MADAIFIFHGLFPDVVDNNHRSIAKILFDIDFDNHLHSHCLADIEQTAPNEFEIRGQLPINCPGFAQAALDYYRYAIGPQKKHHQPQWTQGCQPRQPQCNPCAVVYSFRGESLN